MRRHSSVAGFRDERADPRPGDARVLWAPPRVLCWAVGSGPGQLTPRLCPPQSLCRRPWRLGRSANTDQNLPPRPQPWLSVPAPPQSVTLWDRAESLVHRNKDVTPPFSAHKEFPGLSSSTGHPGCKPENCDDPEDSCLHVDTPTKCLINVLRSSPTLQGHRICHLEGTCPPRGDGQTDAPTTPGHVTQQGLSGL